MRSRFREKGRLGQKNRQTGKQRNKVRMRARRGGKVR